MISTTSGEGSAQIVPKTASPARILFLTGLLSIRVYPPTLCSIRRGRIPLCGARARVSLRAADQHSGEEDEAAADDDLQDREPEVHGEVPVADKRDRDQFDAHD